MAASWTCVPKRTSGPEPRRASELWALPFRRRDVIVELATAVALTLSSSAMASTEVGQRTAEVELRLDRPLVFGGERPKATLVNPGHVRLVHGVRFTLERRQEGGWRVVNCGQAFIMPLLELRAGEVSAPQPIGFYGPPGPRRELKPGLYRVTKSVWPARTYPGRPMLRVSAIFRVAADAG